MLTVKSFINKVRSSIPEKNINWKFNCYSQYIFFNLTLLYLFLDRPGRPEEPLQAFDVTRNSVKLTWEPPLDDGGSPITHYIVEKMDTSRGSWGEACQTSFPRADVFGLTHMKEYMFRIRAVNAVGESEPLTADNGIIARNPYGK